MAFPLDLPGLFTASFHVNTGSDTSDRPGVHLRPCTCIFTTLSGDALSLDANISCMVMYWLAAAASEMWGLGYKHTVAQPLA